MNPFPTEFFEALGHPKPSYQFGLLEAYRFRMVIEHLAPGSVLDVGAYYGDFLELARAQGREIKGTEINQARVDLANSMLGDDVVVLDSRNGDLISLADNSYDNVVCMEVLEHQPDHKHAIDELCRVARSKVLITVPFQEIIRTVICLHCHQYTPYSGHLHRYDYGTFASLAPDGWQVTLELPFANFLTRRLGHRLAASKLNERLLRLTDKFSSRQNRWIMVTLEPVVDFALPRQLT